MSQAALAEAAGVSRQTLGAIEAGRTDPAISIVAALARALECRVDDLYGGGEAAAPRVQAEIAGAMSGGRVELAFLRERWVAHPLAATRPEGAIRAADGVVAGRGQGRGMVAIDLLRTPAEARSTVMLSGCAPALGLLAAFLNSRPGPGRFVWQAQSSTASLRALDRAHVHVAGVHLEEGAGGASNAAPVRRHVPGKDLVLLRLVGWDAGLVVRAGNPLAIRGAGDLARHGVRVVAREKGSGARKLLERALAGAGLDAARVLAGTTEARGHFELAQAIALGAADVGLAMRGAALAYGLDFVPLAAERFDLVLPAESTGDPRIARLADALSGASFKRELAEIGGYDAAECGRQVTEIRAA